MEKTDVNAPQKGTQSQAGELPPNPENVDWKKRYDDSTRGAHQLKAKNDKTESLAVKVIVDKVVAEPGYLQTIASEDKEIADKVAQQLRPMGGGNNFSNFEDYMAYVSSTSGQANRKQVQDAPAGFTKEELLKDLMHEMTKKDIEKLVNAEISKIPEAQREAVKAKFEAFTGRRQLSAEEAQAFLADAKAVVYATSGGNVDELIAKMASNTTKSANPSKDNAPRTSTKELADRLGMGYLFKEKK